jgi:hypothetical protein
MFFPSIDSSYRISSASTTYMHTCLLRATTATAGLASWSRFIDESACKRRSTSRPGPRLRLGITLRPTLTLRGPPKFKMEIVHRKESDV